MATKPGSVAPGLLGKVALCTTPFVVAAALAAWGGSSRGTARGDVAAERASVGHVTARLTLTSKKKGRYTYLCPVPGRAAAGMKGVFTVR